MQFLSDGVAEDFIASIATSGFEHITKLPLCQIPEAIRKNDPNLKNEPLYEIKSDSNENYKVMLGDHVIGLAITNRYTSWSESFYPQIEELFSVILKDQKFNDIHRIGLRYIDFFEKQDIFQHSKIKVSIGGDKNSNPKKMLLSVEDVLDEVNYRRTIVNDTEYSNFTNKGFIVDIITSIEHCNLNKQDLKPIFNQINNLHTVNKTIFKEVISDKYIKQYQL